MDVHGAPIDETLAENAEAQFRQLLAIIDRNALKPRIIPAE